MTIKFSSLQLHGYKTFARQTDLAFPARVTAIVGPNGSGKSNVADSIRWVLGEQSYSLLRAKKTEDMIYIGSDQRARAGMASVTITFDNSDHWLPIDYSEVVLTRRAYRDGQNEYFLNNQRVRLKDFHELLAKTGLSDRTYTIIGQGLVDLALSIKPDERRKLFEEAAGIGLYQARKEEALKRLDITERNLERAMDILEEIKPRLRSLEKQATKVGEYKLVQSNLQKNLREWYGYHWFRAQDEIASIMEESNKAHLNSETVSTLQAENERAITQLREEITDHRRLLDETQKKSQNILMRIQENSQRNAILEERKQASLHSQAQNELDIVHLEETVKSGELELETLNKENECIISELGEIDQQFLAISKDLDKTRNEKNQLELERNNIQTELENLEKEIVVNRLRSTDLRERILDFQDAQKSTQKVIDNLDKQDEEIQKRQIHLSSQLNAKANECALNEAKIRRVEGLISQIAEDLKENESQLNKLDFEKNKYLNRIELLQQNQKNFASFSEGAKQILKQGPADLVITDLASKLDVPQEYEKAIAAALGEVVDLLVIQNGTMGIELLQKFAEDVTDRVAIISRERIKHPKRRPVPEETGVIGLASDLIKNPGELKSLIELLLNEFLIVKDVTSAINLKTDILESFSIVTLNGEVFLRNGISILGKGHKTAKVSYVRLNNELRSSIELVDESIAEVQKNKDDNLQKLLSLKEQKEGFNNQDVLFSQEIKNLQKQLNEILINVQKNTGQRDWIEKQVLDLTSNIEKSENDLVRITNENKILELLINQLNEKSKSLKLQLSDVQVEDLEQKFRYLDMEKRMLENSLAHNNSLSKTTLARCENDKQRLEQLIHRRIETNRIVSQIEQDVSALMDSLSVLKLELLKVNQSFIEPTQNQLTVCETNLKKLAEVEVDLQKENSIRERQATQFQLELARHQEKLESLKNRIEDDFGLIELEYRNENSKLTPLPFPDIIIESLPEVKKLPDGIDQLIKDDKQHLRRIGVVNLDSEIEYQEVKDRYDNLTLQIEDLRSAINDLQKIIKDLDDVMQREFTETFKAVSSEFTKMFSRLFNGGSARLILSDENSPIEGGIEIEARLPGKREQGLVLLSGGERSLTAVALVFALLKISPTPFCVLDEVDAMLDESNVGRFIELLKDLSSETQFLLITHNRNTVQAADVIYGVTMGKDSSSQVMSLILDEVDESYVK